MPESVEGAFSNDSVHCPYASIDVGTNSVKIVIADLSREPAQRIFEESVTTRLGEGMTPHLRQLREAPMRRTLEAIDRYVRLAREHDVRGIASVGTAALREAENQEEFLRRARERCGLEIQVIPGEEEARLSYVAVRRDPLWQKYPRLLVLEIGGGSAQISQGIPFSDQLAARISLPIGAVRVTEAYLHSDPPTLQQLSEANEATSEAFIALKIVPGEQPFHVVGVGGTITNLGAMERGAFMAPDQLHGTVLTVDTLERRIANLSAMTVADRKTLPGLDPQRADIILGGAMILDHILARVGASQLTISTRGLRWGLLYDRFLPSRSQQTF